MAMGGWVVSAVVRFSTTGVSSLRGAAAEIGRMDAMVDGHTSKLKRLTRAYEAHRQKMLQFGATTTAVMALAGGAFIVGGIKMAADLQRSLTGLNVATMNQDPKAMYKMVMGVSGITAQGATTIANEAAMAASAGLNNTKYLRQAFPTIAKAADVANLGPHKLDPVETTKQLAQLSHLFGIFQGPAYTRMIDSAIRLQYLQPEGLGPMNRQGRLFIGQAMRGGVPMDDIFQLLAIMGQQGFLQGRGGSGIGNFVTRMLGASALTSHMSKAMHAAMVGMHMFNAQGANKFVSYDSQGNQKLDVLGAIKYIGQLFANDPQMKRHGVQWLHDAFTTTGGNELSVLSRPTVQQKMSENARNFGLIPGVEKQWEMFVKSNFWGQFQYALTNIGNVITEIWMPMLPTFTAMFTKLGDTFGKFGKFLLANPDAAKHWAYGIIAFTVSMGLAWSVFAASLARSAIMMPFAMARMAAAITALTASTSANATVMGTESAVAGGALGRVAGALRGLAGAGAALLASPLFKMLSLGSVFLGTTSFISKKQAEADRKTFHPGKPNSVIDNLENWIFQGVPGPKVAPAHRALPRQHASSGHVTHVAKVEVVFPNVKDGPGAKVAMLDLFQNPLSQLYNAGSTRTHANIPFVMTAVPA